MRLGTRPSALAMAQARTVAGEWERRCEGLRVEIVPITTSGDRHQGIGDLLALGGKGAFVKEIDRALIDGEIDAALHCAKDLPGDVPRPEGVALGACLEREDAGDIAVFRDGDVARTLADLPAGARVGTSAVRRCAQLMQRYPQLRFEPVRGNVDTRLAKLDKGDYAAIVLARVGLLRLGVERVHERLDILPAVGAGVLVLECRAGDRAVAEQAERLDHAPTRSRLAAERALLAVLRGSCDTPIAGHARLRGELELRAAVFSRDGARVLTASRTAPAAEAERLGAAVGGELLDRGAGELIHQA
ncbi:hydroxymethylbilane synthase [Actinomadura logoneensis]|uniref:Porphobilinogen deaminase n=1 Tax=Actinomadura logoneensis TaxID=2293572 RepID=A0A372JD77_9ACTN|nr:hydroxymethylbilane synthase [Actinomadura logoneensis]RFU37338.1 hydroxymethylbilane synthase [Actinomadura logoneensis]